MRFYEISSGLRLPVSLEEQEIIDILMKNKVLLKNELTERQQEIARNMVSRGLLLRKRDKNKQVVFELNSNDDIWRF